MSYNSLLASEVKSEIGHELQSPIAPVSNNSKSETELFPLVTSQGTTRFLHAKPSFDAHVRLRSEGKADRQTIHVGHQWLIVQVAFFSSLRNVTVI